MLYEMLSIPVVVSAFLEITFWNSALDISVDVSNRFGYSIWRLAFYTTGESVCAIFLHSWLPSDYWFVA